MTEEEQEKVLCRQLEEVLRGKEGHVIIWSISNIIAAVLKDFSEEARERIKKKILELVDELIGIKRNDC